MFAAACSVALAGAPVPPPPQQQQGQQGHVVLVIGDSQAQGLAAGLHRAAKKAGWARVLNNGKPSTGLVLIKTFNWANAAPELIKETKPDIVVLMIGANDHIPLRLDNGVAVFFGNDAWRAAYRARAVALARAVKQTGARLVWVGNPIAQDPGYSDAMKLINEIDADAAKEAGAAFLDIWLAVSDGAGKYAGSGPDLSGATVRLRLDDGIHFTPAGYDIIADRVVHGVSTLQLASSQK